MNKLILRTNNMETIVPACDIVVSDLIERWRSSCGKELPALDDELYLWSLEVMVSILVGPKYREHRAELVPAMKHISSVVRAIFEHTSRLSLLPPQLAYALGLAPWKDFEAAVDETLASANAFVENLLSLRHLNGSGLLSRMLAEGLDLKIIQRIVADFILAAGDTTVYTLQWALYELARNPQLQDELYEQSLLVNSAKELSELPLAKWTLRETLRLYPVAIFLSRYLPEECELAGYKIDAGTLVILSLYTSGRDEKNFAEAERFWPARWARDGSGAYAGVAAPFASIPFALGSRSCIGRRVAEAQLTLTIAQLMKNFRMEIVNTNPIELTLRMIAVPSEPLQLKLTSR
ncbi:Ecdysone 20-monooxygenase [Gryllus bimaculatus]|nr:Ecdysone 20-monooxygenase [Gryllus bimaculatus]